MHENFKDEFSNIDRKFSKRELVTTIYMLLQASDESGDLITIDDVVQVLDEVRAFDEVEQTIKEKFYI